MKQDGLLDNRHTNEQSAMALVKVCSLRDVIDVSCDLVDPGQRAEDQGGGRKLLGQFFRQPELPAQRATDLMGADPTGEACHVEDVEALRIEAIEERGAAGERSSYGRRFQLAIGRGHEAELADPEVMKSLYQGTRRPGAGEVARNPDSKVIKLPEPCADVEEVDEGLGWVMGRAAAAVDHRHWRDLQNLPERFLVSVAKDDSVAIPGNAPEGIDRCFLFRHSGLVTQGKELEGRRSQPSGCGLEAETRPGRRLKKADADHDAAGKARSGGVQAPQVLAAVEDADQFLAAEITDVEEMAVRR
jgi:hypothetical protein